MTTAKLFTGVYIERGRPFRLTIEAESLEHAMSWASTRHVGIEGEGGVALPPPELPHAYCVEDACRLLGGVSRTTLYRMCVRGDLDRVPGTASVLITRESMERLTSKRK